MIERKSSSQASHEGNGNFAGLSVSEIESRSEEFCRKIDELSSATHSKTITLFKLGEVLGFKTYESAKVVKNSGLIRETAKKLNIPSAWILKPLFSPEEAKKIVTEFAKEEIPQKKTEGSRKGNKKISTAAASMKLPEEKGNYSILDIGRCMGFNVYEYKNVKTVQNSGLIRKTAQNLGIATAYDRKPNFSLKEARRIIAKLIPEKLIEIPRKKVCAIKESISQISDENRTIMFGERKIIFSKISGKKMVILRILAETSVENPISSSSLAKKVYGDEVSLRAAKNRVGAMLHNLRGSLGEYDLSIMTKEIEKGGKRGSKTVCYYLVDKSNSTKANDSKEKSIKSEIPAEGDIFVETEISDSAKESRLREEPVEIPITAAEDIFNAGEDGEEDETSDEEKTSGNSGSEFLIPRGFEGFRFSEQKEKLDSKFLLTENEACIVAVSLYKRGADLKMNIASIDSWEIEDLFRRIARRLEKKNQTRADLEKESLLFAIDKLKKFQEDRERYLRSCDKVTKTILKCFDGVEITDGLLGKLFPEPEQVKLIKEARAKTEA